MEGDRGERERSAPRPGRRMQDADWGGQVRLLLTLMESGLTLIKRRTGAPEVSL